MLKIVKQNYNGETGQTDFVLTNGNITVDVTTGRPQIEFLQFHDKKSGLIYLWDSSMPRENLDAFFGYFIIDGGLRQIGGMINAAIWGHS